MLLLSSAYFFQIFFQKNLFRNTIRMSNHLDPDPNVPFVSPDLDPNCLQRLSALRLNCHGKEIVKASIAALAECFTLFSMV